MGEARGSSRKQQWRRRPKLQKTRTVRARERGEMGMAGTEG